MTSARARAALAYAGLTEPAAAARSGIGLATLRRILSRYCRREPNLEESIRLAVATAIPIDWFLFGAWDETEPTTLPAIEDEAERLARAERIVAGLVERGSENPSADA